MTWNSNVTVANVGRWRGIKRADGTVEFRGGVLQVTSKVDGKKRVSHVRLDMPVTGQLVDQVKTVWFWNQWVTWRTASLTIKGSQHSGDTGVDFNIVVDFTDGAPRAVIAKQSVDCVYTDFGAYRIPFCDTEYDASNSVTFAAGPVSSYRWYDADGNLLSSSATYTRRHSPFVSPPTLPITLVVEDSDGRFDTESTN